MEDHSRGRRLLRDAPRRYAHSPCPSSHAAPDPIRGTVSPDGTKLAYIRDTYLRPGHSRYELFVRDLSSGHAANLGPIGPAGPAADFTYTFAWNNDSILLLVQSNDRRSIDWINLESRTRGTYLSVSDRRIKAAYASVHPSAGSPTEIRPIGWTPNPRFTGFAVLVSGRDGANAAVVVLRNGPTRAFAVPRNATGVKFTWAVTSTRFLIASWVDARRGPTDWTLSVGNARTGHLLQIAKAPRTLSALLDPAGKVVVYAPDPDHWVFVPVGRCSRLRACERRIQMRGFLLAWAA